MLNKLAALTLLSLLTFSCASRLTVPAGIPEISASDYENLVAEKTKKLEVYDGLYNKLTVHATWLDSKMTDAGLSHSARILQWNEAKYKEERAKKVGKNIESTTFFVSFYTPERKHADLSTSRSPWKIFLDVGGQRYEGKATKVKLLLSEIQAMYAHHSRWASAYTVSFPVATSLVENKEATLTFAGAIGSAQLFYK